MSRPMDLAELQKEWQTLRSQEKDTTSAEPLKTFLAKTVTAGESIIKPGERFSLQQLAHSVGDEIFRVTREYPATALKTSSMGGGAQPRTIFHHQPQKRFFSITEEQLEQLTRRSGEEWHQMFLLSLTICLATGLNALAEAQELTTELTLTSPLFVNSIFAVASLVLSIVFGWLWWTNRRERDRLLTMIRETPELLLDEQTFSGPVQPIVEESMLGEQAEKGESGSSDATAEASRRAG